MGPVLHRTHFRLNCFVFYIFLNCIQTKKGLLCILSMMPFYFFWEKESNTPTCIYCNMFNYSGKHFLFLSNFKKYLFSNYRYSCVVPYFVLTQSTSCLEGIITKITWNSNSFYMIGLNVFSYILRASFFSTHVADG